MLTAKHHVGPSNMRLADSMTLGMEHCVQTSQRDVRRSMAIHSTSRTTVAHHQFSSIPTVITPILMLKLRFPLFLHGIRIRYLQQDQISSGFAKDEQRQELPREARCVLQRPAYHQP